MHSFNKIANLREQVQIQKELGQIIGLVPTMGNLHKGHLKLVEKAKQQCDFVICSIFVNPLQFGPNEDLAAYPRTLENDKKLLIDKNCDCLFNPSIEEIYPQGTESQAIVSVPGLTQDYCGKSRPGHFDGVTTVVSRLFNICQPDRAYFGLKDYQQFLVIKRLIQDLHYPIEIIGVETQREENGLAMSSRNNYLTEQQRQLAPFFNQTLRALADKLTSGEKGFSALENNAKQELESKGIVPDYIAICNSTTLRPASTSDQELVILGAILLGKSRLIDNILVQLK